MSEIKSPLKLLKVLYLEDDFLMQKIVSDALKPQVKELIIGDDGLFGLGLYKKYKPDVLITDVHMPKMSGLELIQEIRKIDSDLPIVVTSGAIDTNTLLASIDMKIDKYIVKPFTPAEIVAILEMLSKKIISKKLIENEMLLSDFSDEHKKFISTNIRNAFSTHLKNITGKGAGKTTVEFHEKTLIITLYDCFNPLDIRLSHSIYDPTILESMHKAYYFHIKSELEDVIFEHSGLSVSLVNAFINIKSRSEIFHFMPKSVEPF